MTKGQETAQRLIAIVVIMAMLGVMGIPLTVIVFFATVVYFVWRAVQRSEQQDVKNIFDFYIAANEILRDEEKRWYGFEINSVVTEGERVLHQMPEDRGVHTLPGNRQTHAPAPPMPPPIAEVLRDVYEEEKKTA